MPCCAPCTALTSRSRSSRWLLWPSQTVHLSDKPVRGAGHHMSLYPQLLDQGAPNCDPRPSKTQGIACGAPLCIDLALESHVVSPDKAADAIHEYVKCKLVLRGDLPEASIPCLCPGSCLPFDGTSACSAAQMKRNDIQLAHVLVEKLAHRPGDECIAQTVKPIFAQSTVLGNAGV